MAAAAPGAAAVFPRCHFFNRLGLHIAAYLFLVAGGGGGWGARGGIRNAEIALRRPRNDGAQCPCRTGTLRAAEPNVEPCLLMWVRKDLVILLAAVASLLPRLSEVGLGTAGALQMPRLRCEQTLRLRWPGCCCWGFAIIVIERLVAPFLPY